MPTFTGARNPQNKVSPRTIWSARLAGEIPTLYEAGELTCARIAELLNVTPATVARYLPETTAQERRRHDVGVLHRKDYVRAAIADELGLSDRTTGRYLRQHSGMTPEGAGRIGYRPSPAEVRGGAAASVSGSP